MGERILIINADDLGYDPAVTRGILQSMKSGVVTSATFMVNTPYSEAAATEGRGLALGLHLNLARHAPVSRGFPTQFLEQGELSEKRAGELPAEVVDQETRGQLERLEKLLGAKATHIDVHKHLHRHPSVLQGLAAAARDAQLPVRSIDPTMRRELRSMGVKTNEHFIGDAGAQAYWTLAQLENDLQTLQDGVTELMCHPGYAPSAAKSGYSQQREVELETFCSPKARTLLESAGVRLADFRAL
jgi:chitin disaccharide deacetylase